MKKILAISIAVIISSTLPAQKQKQKNNNPDKQKQEARDAVLGKQKNKSNKDVDAVWDGTNGGSPRMSKNQPAKVRAAFASDYPHATNVSWSKYRGDWTASFNAGLIRSVAVYHANGERKDTRSVIQKPQLPKVILDNIFKKHPNTQLGDVIKIEVPNRAKDIFRVKTTEAGTSRFIFYDADGKEVTYDY